MKVIMTKGDYLVTQVFLKQLTNSLRFGHPMVSDLRDAVLLEWDEFKKLNNYISPKGYIVVKANDDETVSLEVTDDGMMTASILLNPIILGTIMQKTFDLLDLTRIYIQQVEEQKDLV